MMKVFTTYISRLFAMALLAVLVLVTGCSDTDFAGLLSKGGAEVEVMFYPELDEAQTRALADGTKIDQLVVVAVEAGNAPVITTMDWVDVSQGVKVTLFQGRTYDLLFWAQHKDNGVYTVGETVTADYTKVGSGFAGMEQLDAFYAVRKGVAVGTQPIDGGTITLGRPFAQLNLADLHNPAEEGKNYAATLHVSGAATTFNPFAENAEDFTSGAADATFSYSDYNTQTAEDRLTIGTDTYYYIASAYLFAPATVQVTYSFMENDQEMNCSTQPATVTLAPKKRFNLYGDIILSEDAFDGKLQMGTPLPESYDDATASYLVDECDDLVWMSDAENLSQLTKGNAFTLTTDLNFSADKGIAINSVKLPAGATVNGDGKTIRNASVHGGGLFGDAEDITLSNLTVDGLSAAGIPVTHVGALVNTLKGSATFQNVIVKNATVTTTAGAAGGVVGYIVRKSKDNRDEALEVKFENCQVAATNSIEGTMGEGLFVGLLRGYDNGEKLSFSGCSMLDEAQTKAAAADLDSYYKEANKAAFVDGSFTLYDAWLGNEECYRGIVSFDSKRFVVKWDGTKKIVPLTESDATGTYQAIYSAFDLANLQSQNPTRVIFQDNVDLGGNRTTKKNAFTPIGSIKYLDGKEHSLYNLYVEVDEMGGFISQAGGESTHENLTFESSSVIVHFVTSGAGDRGYAGTLTPAVWSGTDYTVSNIKVNNGYVFGLGKIGGLIGFIDGGTIKSTIKDCNVTSTTVKNEKGKTQELFERSAPGVTVSMKFYAHGEAGGLLGMLMGNSAISNCHVTNSTMDCYGEGNQEQTVNLGGFIPIPIPVTVQGRHVNNFIGNIRTPGIGDTQYPNDVTIDGCSATNNTYVTTDGKRKDDPFKLSSSKETNLVGEPYYLNLYRIPIDPKGSVKIDGVEFLQ